MNSQASNHFSSLTEASQASVGAEKIGTFLLSDRLLVWGVLRGNPSRRALTAMRPLLHAIQIGTLATWGGVAWVGYIGLWLVSASSPPSPPIHENRPFVSPEITLGAPETSAAPAANLPHSQGDSSLISQESTPSLATPNAPPPMPQMAELPPLPEIPALPARPSPAPPSSISPTRSQQSTAHPTPGSTARATRQMTARAGQGNASRSGNSGSTSAVGDASRIARGSMPAPPYPPEARRLGQSGTVIVEFTVDATGKIISALVKSSSSHPLLDHEAVRTVRRWKFPAGAGIMKLERPISFQIR